MRRSLMVAGVLFMISGATSAQFPQPPMEPLKGNPDGQFKGYADRTFQPEAKVNRSHSPVDLPFKGYPDGQFRGDRTKLPPGAMTTGPAIAGKGSTNFPWLDDTPQEAQPQIIIVRDVEHVRVYVPPQFDTQILGKQIFAESREEKDRSMSHRLSGRPVTVRMRSDDRDKSTIRITCDEEQVTIELPPGTSYAVRSLR